MKQSGSSIGIFSFVALAARFFSGPLADTRGRKHAFCIGLLCCAIAGTVYLAPLGIAGVYLARILQGFGEAFLYTGAATWAVEIAGVHRSSSGAGIRQQRNLGRDVRRAGTRPVGSGRSSTPR